MKTERKWREKKNKEQRIKEQRIKGRGKKRKTRTDKKQKVFKNFWMSKKKLSLNNR